jgi:hypothetical protein
LLEKSAWVLNQADFLYLASDRLIEKDGAINRRVLKRKENPPFRA